MRQTSDTHPQTVPCAFYWNENSLIFRIAAMKTLLGYIGLWPVFCMFMDGFFRECRCFSLFNGESSFRAHADTETGTVAQFFPYHLRLSIYNLNGTFSARAHAKPATRAAILIDLYYLPKRQGQHLAFGFHPVWIVRPCDAFSLLPGFLSFLNRICPVPETQAQTGRSYPDEAREDRKSRSLSSVALFKPF